MKRPKQRRPWETEFTAKGASLIEVTVAMAIVVITALASASFFTSQTSQVSNLTRNSACKAALNSQLSYFRQSLPSAEGLPWTQDSGLPMRVVPSNASWFADSVIQPTSLLTQDLIPSGTGAGGRTFKTYLLQQGSMGLLGALYRNVPGICAAPVDISTIPHQGAGDLPATVDSSLLPGFKATMQIEPFDLTTGATVPSCPAIWARPKGRMDAALAALPQPLITFPPDSSSDIGYRVKLRGEYSSGGGTLNCDSSEDFRFPVDRVAPKYSVTLNAFDPGLSGAVTPATAMSPPRARPQCSHTPAAPTTLRLEIGFKESIPAVGAIEPGSIFLCRDVSQQINGPVYCRDAPNADMRGEVYDGTTSAPWVPCGEVTACGIPAASASFVRTGTSEQKYVLNYSSPVPGMSRDGLWGCDIKIDVATVDSAGNFSLLSQKQHPGNAAYRAIVGQYFQPTECWACYKKKSSLLGAIVKMVVVAIAFGVVGAAIFCATGGGGLCKSRGTKFLYNRCFNQHGTGGSKFCRKVPTQYPEWFGKLPVAGVMPTLPAAPAVCPAIPPTNFPGSALTYEFPETLAGGIAEDGGLDYPNGRYCEAQAICGNTGMWEPFPTDDGTPGTITTCGKVYTEKKLDITASPIGSAPPATGTPQCLLFVPDGANLQILGRNYYNPFRVCGPGTTGLLYNALCRTPSGTVRYPIDARLGTPNNLNPNNYLYHEYTTPVNASLPVCTE